MAKPSLTESTARTRPSRSRLDGLLAPRRLIEAPDVGIHCLFLLVSILAFLGRWEDGSGVLTGDAAAYVASVAARLAPERFAGDLMLSDPALHAFNTTALTIYLGWARQLLGSFELALLILLIPVVFFQLAGFYRLGRCLGFARALATLFALSTLTFIRLVFPGEYWGLDTDPLARTLFQAAFPWLWVIILNGRFAQPARIGAMVASGLLVYLHPHSALGQAFAVWAGLVLVRPANKGWLRHVASHAVFGIVFAALALPFAWNFLASTTPQAASIDPALVRAIMHVRLPGYVDPLENILALLGTIWLEAGACVAGMLALWHLRVDLRPFVTFTAGWIAGLAIIAIIAPAIDHELARRLERLPFQYDLPRSLRYIVPIGWLYVALLAHEAARRVTVETRAHAAALAAFVAVVSINLQAKRHTIPSIISHEVRCIMKARLMCESGKLPKIAHALAAARDMPVGVRFLPEAMYSGLALRYSAMKPVVYTYKEGAWLIYAKRHREMAVWMRRMQAMREAAERRAGPGGSIAAWYSEVETWGRQFGATHLFIERDAREILGIDNTRIVYASPEASIVQIRPLQPVGR